MQLPSVGIRYMLASTLFFSVMSVLVKWTGRRIPHEELVFFRSVVTLGLSVYALRRAGMRPWGVNRRMLLLRGLMGFAGLNCYFYAVTHLPLGVATVVHATNPLLTALLASMWLREAAGVREIVALVLGLCGVVLVANPGWNPQQLVALSPWGLAAAMGGACFSAVAYVSVRQLAKTDHPLVVVFWFPLVAVPASVPGMLANGVWPNGLELAGLLGVGAATQAGQVCMTRGLQMEKASTATSVTTVQVVLAWVLGVVLFAEPVGVSGVLGGLLVMLGVVIVSRVAR